MRFDAVAAKDALAAEIAFGAAIGQGLLSDSPESPLYAGNFMYMGDGKFKHKVTRSYLSPCGKHLRRWSDGAFETFGGEPTSCASCKNGDGG